MDEKIPWWEVSPPEAYCPHCETKNKRIAELEVMCRDLAYAEQEARVRLDAVHSNIADYRAGLLVDADACVDLIAESLEQKE